MYHNVNETDSICDINIIQQNEIFAISLNGDISTSSSATTSSAGSLRSLHITTVDDSPSSTSDLVKKKQSMSNDCGCNLLSSDSVTLLELVALTSFNFPYGFIIGTFGLWVLPSEALRLFPLHPSLALGLLLVVTGVSQLVCPVAGKFSDHYSSATRFGKRRPFILWGCAVALVACLGMWQSSLYLWGYLYHFFLFVGMCSLNVVYAAHCGIVPDLLNTDVQGKASGLVAVHCLLGSASGFAILMLTANANHLFVYWIYIILVTITCWMSVVIGNRLQERLDRNLSAGLFQQVASTGDLKDNRIPIITHPVNELVCFKEKNANYGHVTLTNESPDEYNRANNSNNGGDNDPHQPYNSSAKKATVYPENSNVEEDNHTRRQPSAKRLDTEYDGIEMVPFENLQLDPEYDGVKMVPFDNIQVDITDGIIEERNKEPKQKQNQQNLHVYHAPNNLGTTRSTSPLTLAEIIESYKIDISTSYDFFWVFSGRTLYYMGVSVQTYFLYFLKDVVRSTEADAQFQLGCIALLAQFCAALVAYPVGKMTDTTAVSKKLLIYLSCLSMSAVYIGFAISPLFGKGAFCFILSAGALYGAGNGCFLAVDYGLALATIPNKSKTSQSLGIWGVSAFIGSALGPFLWGGILEIFGRNTETNGYLYRGYIVMLFGGIVATWSAGAVVKLIKAVK